MTSSCLDPISKNPPVIIQGEDDTLDVRLISEKTNDPFDVTGATEIEAKFQNFDGTVKVFKLSLSEISIVSGVGGHIRIILDASSTVLLKPSASNGLSSFELYVTILGKITIIQFVNQIKIKSKLFNP